MNYEITASGEPNIVMNVKAESPEEALQEVLSFIHRKRFMRNDISQYTPDKRLEKEEGICYEDDQFDVFWVQEADISWIEQL